MLAFGSADFTVFAINAAAVSTALVANFDTGFASVAAEAFDAFATAGFADDFSDFEAGFAVFLTAFAAAFDAGFDVDFAPDFTGGFAADFVGFDSFGDLPFAALAFGFAPAFAAGLEADFFDGPVEFALAFLAIHPPKNRNENEMN